MRTNTINHLINTSVLCPQLTQVMSKSINTYWQRGLKKKPTHQHQHEIIYGDQTLGQIYLD